MEVGATPEVQEGVSEHEQSMMDLVDTKEAETEGQVDPEKAPEYVEPEEPKTIDYKAEYEKLLSEKDTTKPEEEIPETPEEEPEDSEQSLVTPDVISKYVTEFNSGGITEESYAEAKAAGYSKEVVDNYVAGQVAIAQAQNQRVFEKAGGPVEYNSMITWAKESWSPEQIAVFNEQVNSGDETKIMYGVDALKAQYTAANTGLPSRALKGDSGSSGGSQGFSDKGEMYKAMNNKLYGKDASYTNMVTKKIGLSKF